jgi:hypothetical protein
MPDIAWQQVLGAGYYLGALASLLGAVRCVIDYHRKGQRWQWLGIPAHIGLATALSFIIIATGPDPAFSPEFMQIAIRVSFMTWAVFKLLFMLGYCVTHIGVKGK